MSYRPAQPASPHDSARASGVADLTGRRALVAGGGAGIGLACAERLACAGAHVIVAGIDEPSALAVADRIGGDAWIVNLADAGTAPAAPPGVDILVNNAGVQYVSPIEDFPVEQFDRILALMLRAPFLPARSVLPHVYREGFGRIVNVSSVHGLTASPYKSAYVAAKHGLEGLSKVIALEGGPRGVTSNCVNPAFARTALVEKQIADQARLNGVSEEDVVRDVMLVEPAIKRLVEPAEVAELVAYLCSDAAAFINGSSLSIDGDWTAR